MSTRFPEFFAALAAPFHPNEIKVRDAPGGRKLQYVTARTIMNRLDEVAGPEGWWDEYEPHETSVLCRLSLRLPDGQVLTKCDVGGHAGMSDGGDDDKSAFSDALKRAAAKHCCGRYLYRDGVPTYHAAEPARVPQSPPARESSGPVAPAPEPATVGITGKGLFAFLHKTEEQRGTGLMADIVAWGKRQRYPERMIDWTLDQAEAAYREALRLLGSAPTGDQLAALRRELTGLVTSIAQVRARSAEPGVDDLRAVLTDIAVTHPQRKEILSLKRCDDGPLLSFYIAAARNIAEQIFQEGRQEALERQAREEAEKKARASA